MSFWTPSRLVGVGQGVDLVDVGGVAEQLAIPGSTFGRVFTDREWSRCLTRGGGQAAGVTTRTAASLAARWAAKEAAVKAWSTLLHGQAPALAEEELDWACIEVVHDRWDRPALRFHGRVREELEALAARESVRLEWRLSLSHDGGAAIAHVSVYALLDEDSPSPASPAMPE